MFRPMKFISYLLYLNLTFLLACSGGTGGTGFSGGNSNVVVGTITQISTNSAAGAQTTGTQQAISVAAVAGNNTVTINGIQFDISSSSINLDGLSGTEADLRVGMVATIKGSVDANGTTGIADTLSVREVIKGPVTNVDTANNTITVLGQTVQVSATTHLEDVPTQAIGGINIKDIVEVSGYVKNNNVIAATRIELLNDSETQFKVTGSISNLNTLNTTFNLGSLIVDYSNASLNNLPNDTLADGLFVEVKGTFDTGNSRLVATEVNAEQLDINNADNMQLQGFVTSVESATNFSVNHQPVTFDDNTQYHGGTATDIVAGVLVSVRGPLVNHILIANEVSFENSIKITSVVSAVDANSISLTGLSNINISIDASTEFEGAIMAGYTVTVHGNLIPSNNTVVANQITVGSTDASTEVSLQGPVSSIVDPLVTLLGINIDTSSFQDADFIVEGAMINSRTYFFSLVSVDEVVTAQGTLDGSTITWLSLSFENSNQQQ